MIPVEEVRVGGRYRFNDGHVVEVTKVERGGVPAYGGPVDVEEKFLDGNLKGRKMAWGSLESFALAVRHAD